MERDLFLVKRCHPLFYRGDFLENHGLEPSIPVSCMENAQKLAEADRYCFGYYVLQQEYLVVNGKRFEAKPESIKSVIFGEVFNIEQIKAMPSTHALDVLLQDMEEKRQNKSIKTRTGGWLDIEKEKDAEIIFAKSVF